MLTFYDTVAAGRLPGATTHFAGYVDGRWPSLEAMRRRFPQGEWLSIATSAAHDAMVLDVESGDATVAEAVGWVRRMRRRGTMRPCLYLSLSRVPELERGLAAARLLRSNVRLWTAHYTGHPHICSADCGVPMEERPGATQHTNDQARDVDISLTTPGWWNAVRHDYFHPR